MEWSTGEAGHGVQVASLVCIGLAATGIDEMFCGLWLLPFGWPVVCSRFLPRWLGYWLLLDGIALVFISVTWFLALTNADALFRYFQPIFMAELAPMLWLLIVGVREQPLVAAATA
jgi:hypothetical protein